MHRFADTLLGVGVGLVVNMLILPPLDHGLAERQRDLVTTRLGRLLLRMADEMSHSAREEQPRRGSRRPARSTVTSTAPRSCSASRPRATAGTHGAGSRVRVADVEAGEVELVRLEDAVARARSIARIVGEAVATSAEWDPPLPRALARPPPRGGRPGDRLGPLARRAEQPGRRADRPAVRGRAAGSLLAGLRRAAAVARRDHHGRRRGHRRRRGRAGVARRPRPRPSYGREQQRQLRRRGVGGPHSRAASTCSRRMSACPLWWASSRSTCSRSAQTARGPRPSPRRRGRGRRGGAARPSQARRWASRTEAIVSSRRSAKERVGVEATPRSRSDVPVTAWSNQTRST